MNIRKCAEEPKGIMELDRDQVEADFEALSKEVERIELDIEFIQEFNFRMYYLLLEIMVSVNGTQWEEPILQPPEWRDYPFFLTFETWKQMQKAQIIEAFTFIEKSRKLSNLGVCKAVVEHVHRHFREQISIKEVADLFYMNSAYLGRAFQKATGISFKQYVNDLRLQEAKRLLLQTDKLIYEIAEAVGYTESKYFVSKFTSEVGVSPTCYRKGEYCQKTEHEVYFSE